MIIDFSVENFLSFNEETVFSFVAESKVNKKDYLEANTFFADDKKELKLLKSIAIYGPNASGKTNLLVALDAFRHIVKESSKMNSPDQYEPIDSFRLDETKSTKPSCFQISFIANGKRYQYGVSLTKEKIFSEYLYYYPNKKKNVIFERHYDDNQSFSILKASKYLSKKDQQELIKKTNSNMLYLSKLDQNNNSYAHDVMKWFIEKINVVPTNKISLTYTIEKIEENPSMKMKILEFLQGLDTGIIDLKVFSYSTFEEYLSTEFGGDTKQQESFMNKLPPDFLSSLKKRFDSDKTMRMKLRSLHKGRDDQGSIKEVEFDIGKESMGTIVLLACLGPIFDVLENKKILFIDEISNNLHPKLVTKLIKLINSDQNTGAQVVFTTHNTTQLNRELLRRDQIWFTEKKKDESTDLFSLADFKSIAREKASFEKQYLKGLYGAVPFI